MSKLAYALIFANSVQSSSLYDAIIDPTNTLSGNSFFNSLPPSTQYLAFFSEINSILENDGSLRKLSLVPLKILGATLTI